jgi:DNA-directed RNA polymerase II subunit RPB1
LEEVVKTIEICFDPDDLNTLIVEDAKTMEQFRYFENMVLECAETCLNDEAADNPKSKWILRMEMDPEIMLEKNITMEDLSFTIRNTFGNDINCVYTDYNADKLIFRIRLNEMMALGQKVGKKKNAAAHADGDVFADQSNQIFLLKNFQEQVLKNTVIRGIKGIGKVTMRKIKDNVVENNGIFVKQDIWVLDTVGTNLLDIMALDYIDPYRTFSNNIVEVYKTLGIEAARQAIYNELVDVIEFDGTYINYHHFSVLVDRMTYTHKLISVFRHGINNDNTGPIAKASFEETPEMFLKAARHADLETMKGISANIMCGQEGHFGTSAFQVFLNLEDLQVLTSESEYKEYDGEDGLSLLGQSSDNKYSTKQLALQSNAVSIKATDMGDEADEYNPGF